MAELKVKPIGENILVKRSEAVKTTKGGIMLPDSAAEKPREGEVIAVGQGRMMANGKRVEFQVKPGNIVLFSSYAGHEVKIDGVEYLLMTEEDMLAIIG